MSKQFEIAFNEFAQKQEIEKIKQEYINDFVDDYLWTYEDELEIQKKLNEYDIQFEIERENEMEFLLKSSLIVLASILIMCLPLIMKEFHTLF